jgi:uncharacterized membrane protein YbhN (UPF0104 family)
MTIFEKAWWMLIGLAWGGVCVWLWVRATDRWKRGRAMMKKPEQVRQDSRKRMKEAKEQRRKGFLEVVWSTIMFLILVVLIFLLALAVNAIRQISGG